MTFPAQMDPAEAAKQKAAEWAAAQVEDGMAVGLGSGTTSALVIQEVGRRVASGLRITAIATSEQSHRQALALGIPITSFAQTPHLDLTIDGADEVQEGTLHLIKGHGGALLREKIVAMASRRLLIAVDPRKLVKALGSVFAVPVEVVPFGWETTATRLREAGFECELRLKDDGQPYITDGQHYILHCDLLKSGQAAEQAAETMKRIVGVVEHGLFLGMASEVVIGGSDGIKILERTIF
ncbi:Ribose 5-phosphate isomerase A [Acidisarcina polymorpha]|uniref:Ribose-5-phosphate isomerase A n=2 Tax=Acidisarcina polymorpha TaxID=2211140 RepID=A0A2Z5G4W8_9BACT|nr:Ribose 5-phosphate isomerase A [Acidisarcina polymorpha]